MSNQGILIYIIALFSVFAAVVTGHLWVAGALLFFAGNFKIISGVVSSEGGHKKFNIFLLVGFNFAFLYSVGMA